MGRELGHAPLAPPTRHHCQGPERHAHHKDDEHNQHQWRTPFRAKEEMHHHFVRIVQREGKEGEKNSRFQYPLKRLEQLVQGGSRVLQNFSPDALAGHLIFFQQTLGDQLLCPRVHSLAQRLARFEVGNPLLRDRHTLA